MNVTSGALVNVGCNVQWTCACVCELCKLVSEIVDCRISKLKGDAEKA